MLRRRILNPLSGVFSSGFYLGLAISLSGLLSSCGDESDVVYVDSETEELEEQDDSSSATAAEQEQEQETSGGAESDEEPSSSIDEQVEQLPLDSSAQDADEGLALEALGDEATAGAFCRWQSVVAQQNSELTDEQCAAQAEECQAEVLGSESEAARLPDVMLTISERLLAIEECELPEETVDRCVAELVPVLEPYAETMKCGEAPGEFPELGNRLAEIPTCVGLGLACPQVLDAVQGGFGPTD